MAVETAAGDAAAADAAFARAAHVVTLDSRINRVTGVPMEPRAAVGDFDAATGATRSTLDQAGRGGFATMSQSFSVCRRNSFASSRAKLAAAMEPESLLSGVPAGRVGGQARGATGEVDGRSSGIADQ